MKFPHKMSKIKCYTITKYKTTVIPSKKQTSSYCFQVHPTYILCMLKLIAPYIFNVRKMSKCNFPIKCEKELDDQVQNTFHTYQVGSYFI